MQPFRTSLLLAVLLLCFPMLAKAQNSAAWEVWRVENPGKISDHSTDSVVVRFDTTGSTINATIICEARTTFGTRSTRRLAMRILGFHGTGQYAPVLGGAASYWENFSRDSLCGCIDNSANKVVINQWDTATKVMAGTFEFRCQSFIATSGDQILYRIRNGSFRWGGTDKIVIKTDPKDTVRVAQIAGEDTTINIIVEATERDAPLEGVSIKYLDKTITGSTVFQLHGSTGSDGKLSYPVTLQRDAPPGDYEVKFYGVKADHDSSDTATVLIRYRNRIWEYKCVGATILSFDAGEGKEWKPVSEGSPLVSASGSIMVNNILEMRGKVRINTTAGAEQIFLDSGKVYLKTTDDNGAPSDMEFTFILGNDGLFRMPDCSGLFDLARDSVVKKLSKKLFGSVEVSIEKFTLINRPTGKGIDFEGKIDFGELVRLGCDPVQDPTGSLNADPASRSITIGLALTTAGFESLKIKAENMKATDMFCLKEFTAGLDNFNKTANIGAKATMNLKGAEFTAAFGAFWKSSTGNLGATDLKLDSLMAELELETCKPIPQTPFCFHAAKFSTSGWANATPAGRAVRLGLVLNSSEQFILDKAPWITTLVGSPQIAQFEGTLEYKHPLIFTGSIISRIIRISKPFESKPWQCEGTVALSLDMNNRLLGTQSGNFFHLGGDDYFISGTIQHQIQWNPMLGYSGTANGSFRIPAPGDDLLEVPGVGSVLRFMKLSGFIPQTLGQASVSAILNQDDGFQIRGTVDVSQNPTPYIRAFGVMSAKVSCINGNWDVNMQQGTIPPGNFIGGDKNPAEGVQVIPAKESDTIIVDPLMTRVFVMIIGAATAPASTITDPSGKTYTETSTDSAVIKFATPGNEMVQWTLNSPEPGKWVLDLTEPKAGDEVEVTVQRLARPFEVDASVQDQLVSVTWDKTNSIADAVVRVFLDENAVGYDGIFIGSVKEESGEYQFAIPAGLSNCSYNVYAQRFSAGEPDAQIYDEEPLPLNTSLVAQPFSVQAVSNDVGRTAITWTVPPGSALSGFHISTVDALGVEELIATAMSDERRVEVVIEGHTGKQIMVRSFDEGGTRSCPTVPVAITTDVTEYKHHFANASGSMTVVPNPAQSSFEVRYHAPMGDAVYVRLYDLLGTEVTTIPVVDPENSGAVVVPCSSLPSGSYLVQIVLESGHVDGIVHIVR